MAEFPSAAALLDTLRRVGAEPDEARRAARLNTVWGGLRGAGQVPFATGDSVVWLYRGTASSVAWAGDHTGWRPSATGQRLASTDLWWRADRFAADARVDYKVVLGGNDWRLDPANPLQQWSGFGPNSELRMPAYVPAVEPVRRAGVGAGVLGPNQTLQSARLGYRVQYRVYTPANYDALRDLPVLFVTDGHEYAPDGLGALVTTLDNGIADGTVAPLVAVFVDPRNPANPGENRRQQEYVPAGARIAGGRAAAFLAALADELVPAVEDAYRVRRGAEARGLLGTSLGGLFAAYAAGQRPDLFHRIAIQSPAFWTWEPVYDPFRAAPAAPLRLYVTQGTIGDGDGGMTLRPLLTANAYAHTYVERNEGHSWGQWRALLPAMLRALYPTAVGTGAAPPPALRSFRLSAAPNPARSATTLHLRLDRPARVTLRVFDGQGRLVATPVRGAALGAGEHRTRLDTRRWAAGRYLARVEAGADSLTVPITVLR